MLSPCPVQEAGLDAGIAPGRGRPSVLARWRWLDIVLAVHSQPLDDLKGVLFVLIRVGIRGLKERRRRLDGCVDRLDRPIALEAGDSHLGFNWSCHSATSKGIPSSEFIPFGANVKGLVSVGSIV